MQYPAARTHVVVVHPLDPADAAVVAGMRAALASVKGLVRGAEGRKPYDALMEGVEPRDDVSFDSDTLGGVPGIWVRPKDYRHDEAILHFHGGWFNLGSARAYRHLVGHIAARSGTQAFIPDYRLAPEHPFPAAVDDAQACYRALGARRIRRFAITGDSAGGNLALGLAASIAGNPAFRKTDVVGVVVMSPVTDLTLSGATYQTRAEADPLFTREQAVVLVGAYLGNADPRHPWASPVEARLSGLPAVRVHVGDAEVLLDDSRLFVERAIAAGVEARLDIWMGMPHGFVASVGRLRAATQALDDIGSFVGERLRAAAPSTGNSAPGDS